MNNKRKRVSRACDRCNKSGTKCTTSEGSSCEACIVAGSECTYDRPIGRRGAPSKLGRLNASPPILQALPPGLTLSSMLYLADVYRMTVYGVYCFFHWPSFIADIRAEKHMTDGAFRASVMAVCAVAAARLRDGACEELIQVWASSLDSLEASFEADVALVDLTRLRNDIMVQISAQTSHNQPSFDHLRATTLLAILGIQNGDSDQVHAMLGQYHGLSARIGFNRESQWPKHITEYERQERRALYWSTYTLDVFSAMVWSGMVRHRSGQSFVAYPDYRLDANVTTDEHCWVNGWNLVTDLYRVLEEIIAVDAHQRQRESRTRPPDLPHPFGHSTFALEEGWHAIKTRYDQMPSIFKEARPITGDFARNIYSFQSANLSVTLQAVRMSIACIQGMSISDQCQVAGDLLDVLAGIPTAYMQLISAPFLHQLASIGRLLGGVVQGPLSISSYLHVRQILLSFGNLLATLETSLKAPTCISDDLFHHVSRIDHFMQGATDQSRPNHLIFTESSASILRKERTTPGIYESTLDLRSLNHTSPIHSGATDISAFIPFEMGSAAEGVADLGKDLLQPTAQAEFDTVFSLPDELVDYWPLNEDQQTLFDSFFGQQHNIE